MTILTGIAIQSSEAAKIEEQPMEVRDAIAQAKTYVTDVFAEQHVSDLRLEEVEYDELQDRWNITISFLRGNDPGETSDVAQTLGVGPPDVGRQLGLIEEIVRRQRIYKSVFLSNDTGRMISIKNSDAVG